MKNKVVMVALGLMFSMMLGCQFDDKKKADSPLIGTDWLFEVNAPGFMYMRGVEKYSDTGINIVYTYYTDGTFGTVAYVQTFTGTYVVGGAASGDPNAKKIDLTLVSGVLVIKDASVLSEFNTNSYYGFSDWAVDIEKNIIGTTDPFGEPVGIVGEVGKDIYKIVGDKLYMGLAEYEDEFGDMVSNLDIDGYPKTLDTEFPWTAK